MALLPDKIPLLLTKILVTAASAISIGFGVWHFTVPKAWHWYSYMDAAATELSVAVWAVNVLFSLSLVLFGLVNLFLVFDSRARRYPLLVVLGASSILWLVRVLLQIVNPQGSMRPVLQYGMLAAFVFVFLCYLVSLVLVAGDKSFRR
jgi:hypothetical protein